jgi:hypothetical protein
VPDAAFLAWHALVIDDLLLFRLVPDTIHADEKERASRFPGPTGVFRGKIGPSPVQCPPSTGTLLGEKDRQEQKENPEKKGRPIPPPTPPSIPPSTSKGIRPYQVQDDSPAGELQGALDRYAEVGLPVKPAKVHPFGPRQDMLGYTLASDVLRVPEVKFRDLEAAVLDLERRGWARPREVEHLVGRFSNLFLLHRPAFAIFSSVYAYARKLGAVAARVWVSVMRELRMALWLLPLIRSDLRRPVSPVLIQTDACESGAAAVYTCAVDAEVLREECRRPVAATTVPTTRLSDAAAGRVEPEPWQVECALAAKFDAPVDPAVWRVAFKRTFAVGRERNGTINAKELAAAVDAVRWASRAPRTRACRLVLQGDSAVAVSILRKGRSSTPALLRQCRRLAAVTLAHQITIEARWISTTRNMADRPSRGDFAPGPCLPEVVRPRGLGQGGYAGQRVGEQKHPGPGSGGLPSSFSFWSPLFDANIADETSRRYAAAVRSFVVFCRAHGERVDSAHDMDYWLAYYAHVAYTTGRPSKSEVKNALYGLEHWLPEVKPLALGRRCVRGWDRLVPPRPAAPMTMDLARACAALACLEGEIGAGLAMLVSFDCWLRISEIAGLRSGAVVDTRGVSDPVGRGVSVFLPETKTGRRQAVKVEDPELAGLLLAWTAVSERSLGPGALLFPSPDRLRAILALCLRRLDDGNWDARGLSFVWHSFRHGGASRAHLAGTGLPDILTRGRWAVDSSGRHYIQAGRQMLLALALPAEVAELARRLERAGISSLFAPDLRRRLQGP